MQGEEKIFPMEISAPYGEIPSDQGGKLQDHRVAEVNQRIVNQSQGLWLAT